VTKCAVEDESETAAGADAGNTSIMPTFDISDQLWNKINMKYAIYNKIQWNE
jgi:hypothetical protein